MVNHQKHAGFSFIELVVVIGLIGIVSALTISSSKTPVNAQKLLTEAQKLAQGLSLMIAKSRASQTSIKLTCDSTKITSNEYRTTTSYDAKSNMILGTIGTNVVAVATGTPTKTSTMVSYSATDALTITCPEAIGYITSDGTIFTSGGNRFIAMFSTTANANIQSRLEISKTGYPRIYMRDASVNANWSEVLR
jgi:prepilin-type N-terminal cleavage/methylation domain-containing protein